MPRDQGERPTIHCHTCDQDVDVDLIQGHQERHAWPDGVPWLDDMDATHKARRKETHDE